MKPLIVFFFCLAVIVGTADAGKLEEFEKDATKDDSHRHRDRYDPYYDRHRYDYHRNRREPRREGIHFSDWELEPHKPGTPILPLVRFDGAYQEIDSQIDARDYYAQIGYEMVGLDIRHTHFQETNPSDHLDVSRIHGLFRLGAAWGGYENDHWFKGYWEVDVGLGAVQLKGHNRNQGVSFTLPVLFHPTDWLGFEFRPAWSSIHGSNMQDYDLSMLLGYRYAGFKLGYRWLRSPTMSLNGPYAGLSVRF